MNPIEIINEYYRQDSIVRKILITHGKLVAAKAVDIALRVSHLNPDVNFIEEASMLHDIGIFMTCSPQIGCDGKHPYVLHGILGREILDKKGLEKHGLVCERHVGVGITIEDIKTQKLPLPERDMSPVSIEEQIICYADKFFSKDSRTGERKTTEDIITQIEKWGPGKIQKFLSWGKLFQDI